MQAEQLALKRTTPSRAVPPAIFAGTASRRGYLGLTGKSAQARAGNDDARAGFTVGRDTKTATCPRLCPARSLPSRSSMTPTALARPGGP